MWRMLVVVVGLAVWPCAAQAGDLRLSGFRDPFAQLAARAGINGAVERLAQPGCRQVLHDFTDAAGRPLTAVLDGSGLEVRDHVALLQFVDAEEGGACSRPGIAAFTSQGGRVVFVCARRLSNEYRSRRPTVEILLIHEILHTLGLGENPPAREEITAQITKRCGRNASSTGR